MKHLTKLLAAALLMLGLNQTVWADDASDFRQTLQLAEQGYAVAQYNLGAMYVTGRGVHQDFHLSKEWFGEACDGGDQKGCDQYRYLNQKGY